MSRKIIRILSVINFILGVAYCFIFLPKLSMLSNFFFYFLLSFVALLLNQLRTKIKEERKPQWKEILIGPLIFSVTAASTFLIAYLFVPSMRNASFAQLTAKEITLATTMYAFYFHYLNFKKLS